MSKRALGSSSASDFFACVCAIPAFSAELESEFALVPARREVEAVVAGAETSGDGDTDADADFDFGPDELFEEVADKDESTTVPALTVTTVVVAVAVLVAAAS